MILLALIAALSAGATTSTDEQAAVARHVDSVQTHTVAAPIDRNYVAGRHEFVVQEPNNASAAKTRAQVMDELEQAKADGTYDAIHQEFDRQYPRTAETWDGATKATGLARADGSFSSR